jgi:predicted metal-dependent peptidase
VRIIFFAVFIIQMKRKIKLNMPAAVGSSAALSHFNIYFNPTIFLQCTMEEMKALLKHEVYHIMNGHMKRASIFGRKYSSLAVSVAMDISINQYIKNLPTWSWSLERARLLFNADLKEDAPMEEYTKMLQLAMDKLKKNSMDENSKSTEKDFFRNEIIKEADEADCHDIWNETKNMVNNEQIDELTKKTSSNAYKGKAPAQIEKLMKEINKRSQIAWQDYLRRAVGSVPSGHKKTITRKYRRQPERLDIRGKLSNHIAKLTIAIDISGSISDSEINEIMVEVFGILKNVTYEITIIECDNEIRRVYKVNDPKNVKRKVETKGGILFSPVFEYIRQHGMKDNILIFFTDGLGEKELSCTPVNYKTIWVLTGKGENLSLNSPYGVIQRLSDINFEKPDLNYAKNEMKEILMEWAK